MQRILLGLAAAVSLAATMFSPVSAQSEPPGSYQQSCTNVRVRGDQLIARCNAPQGGTVRTSIALDSCRGGDIANMNGQLTCNTNGYGRGHRYRNGNGNGNGYGNQNSYGGGNAYGRGNGNSYGYGSAPGGSYQQSCTGAQTRGSMLSATCPAPNGARITSTIDLSACRGGDIANVNGRLECR
jgi:hypothetical protein